MSQLSKPVTAPDRLLSLWAEPDRDGPLGDIRRMSASTPSKALTIMPTITSRPLRQLTIADIALRLQVSIKTMRRWINAGALPVHRLGRLLRVSEQDLGVFLARQHG